MFQYTQILRTLQNVQSLKTIPELRHQIYTDREINFIHFPENVSTDGNWNYQGKLGKEEPNY